MRRAILIALLSGCSAPPPLDTACSGELARAGEPLVNAATDESYLGLAPEHLRAIVQISTGSEPNAPVCSGAFATREWVVSAAHCLVIESPHVVIDSGGAIPELADVIEQVAHPSLDVALLRVAPRDATSFEPMAPLGQSDRAVAVADSVELAGYGLTETGSARELRFLVEPVVRVEDADIIVNGGGASGACDGDSGGPLVVRDSVGAVRVGGVLTSGSPSCLENDRYVRLDRIEAWLDEVTGSHTSSFDACGGIDEAGRCLYGSALFCNGGKLEAEACGDDRACGWDLTRSAYRCVSPAEDPCHGVDSVGACRDDRAMTCDGGALKHQLCACGQTCRIDGKTGSPFCTAP
jgi:hypothetical protein